jgi:acetylornithine/N-succinyldiaminopimelate aminotransferase
MKPLVRGYQEFLYDEDNERYVDAISGVYNVSYGYAHPRILGVLQEFPGGGLINVYDNPTPERKALESALSVLTGFEGVHLFSTGAESVEKALLLALRSVQASRRTVVHFRDGFHGKTMGTYGLFDSRVPLPYTDYVLEPFDLDSLVSYLKRVSGIVILEPVMAYFGTIPSDTQLRTIREICDETESILIFDEMVTGFGRTGVNFVSDKVKPDILVTGKGLGQGLPISAVLFDPKRVNADGISWTTATANNALLCRIGSESVRVLVEEGMALKSQKVGSELVEFLIRRSNIVECCGVLSCGSMVFLKHRTSTMAPVEEQLREKYHILTRAHGSSLVLMPPFVTGSSSLEYIADSVSKII